jgi:hypothetical protein
VSCEKKQDTFGVRVESSFYRDLVTLPESAKLVFDYDPRVITTYDRKIDTRETETDTRKTESS